MSRLPDCRSVYFQGQDYRGMSEAQSGLLKRQRAADAATAVMIGALEHLAPGQSPLIVDEPSSHLAAALAAAGAKPQVWSRHAHTTSAATPWPPVGPFTAAFVRLPKSKAALDFALSAAASTLPPGAPLVLFGGNDEGIRSAAPRLAPFADDVVTVDMRRHCRVLMGIRRAHIAGLRHRLRDWRFLGTISIDGAERPWVTYPGLFAEGMLDEGTALLLLRLPSLRVNARVLDFGCGSGVIGAAVLARYPQASIDLLDADALAIEAARENVPAARLLLGDGLAAAGSARYDAILSNPPIHAGVEEHHGTLRGLIADAPRHLKVTGVLLIVVQRRLKAAEPMQAAFGNVEAVAENSRFRVLLSRMNASS